MNCDLVVDTRLNNGFLLILDFLKVLVFGTVVYFVVMHLSEFSSQVNYGTVDKS